MGIIRSLLDADLYKFKVHSYAYSTCPYTYTQYKFVCRTPNVDFRNCFADICIEINELCELRFTKEEIDYLRSLKIFKEKYLRYLEYFKLDRSNIRLNIDRRGNLSDDIGMAGFYFNHEVK